jgi:threonyl-tRNA synthetase
MLVVGDREQEADEVALREHRAGDRGSVKVGDFAARVREETNIRAP